MFIGHYAVGLATKRLAPRTSLGWLFAAPQFLDLLWPIFLLLGWESVRIAPGDTRFTPLDLHDYPYTHSLAGALVWSALFAATYFALRRDARVAAILAASVFSHWILDFVAHRADMPLWPGSATRVGLGLWNSVPGTLALESALFAGGVWLYASRPGAARGARFWSLIAFLALVYAGVAFGPPPPSARAMAWVALSGWLLVPWAAWVDRPAAAPTSSPHG